VWSVGARRRSFLLEVTFVVGIVESGFKQVGFFRTARQLRLCIATLLISTVVVVEGQSFVLLSRDDGIAQLNLDLGHGRVQRLLVSTNFFKTELVDFGG